MAITDDIKTDLQDLLTAENETTRTALVQNIQSSIDRLNKDYDENATAYTSAMAKIEELRKKNAEFVKSTTAVSTPKAVKAQKNLFADLDKLFERGN